ncbi:hypothetical protein QYM36_006116, partial [Artemia franciscana]
RSAQSGEKGEGSELKVNTDSEQVIISDNDSTPESEVGYDIIDDDTWVLLEVNELDQFWRQLPQRLRLDILNLQGHGFLDLSL